MKKLALLLVPLMLAGCDSLKDLPSGGNPHGPYTVTADDIGYTAKWNDALKTWEYTIPQTKFSIFSVAGAPDIRHLEFVAELYNTNGKQGSIGDSIVLPEKGTLFGNARGGYACVETPATECRLTSADAYFADTGPAVWPENTITKSFLPIDWAAAHFLVNSKDGDQGSGWFVKFHFRAIQSNGAAVVWEQNYQIVTPH